MEVGIGIGMGMGMGMGLGIWMGMGMEGMGIGIEMGKGSPLGWRWVQIGGGWDLTKPYFMIIHFAISSFVPTIDISNKAREQFSPNLPAMIEVRLE